MIGAVLSLLMLAAFALAGGAAYLWRTKGERQRPLLLLLLAGIMLVNVAIWTLPDGGGQAPVERLGD
jgi:hypothetical protein